MKLNNKKLLVFVGVMAVIGAALIIRSLAATPNASLEAENSTKSGVVACADTNASAGNYLKFGTTTCSTTPPPPSDCLKATNIATLTGVVSSYTGTPASNSTVDARSYTVSNDHTWLVTPHSTSGVCWVGGEYMNTIADSATGTLSGSGPGTAWGDYWHHNGGFTIGGDGQGYNNPNWVIDGVTVHHTGDAFNMSSGSANFEIRNSHIYDIRDDCVQNDYYQTGNVHDNLFESCYDGFSSKASSNTSPDGTGHTWTINNNVVYIAPTVSVYKGDSPGSVYILKWQQPGDGLTGIPEHVVFKNNVVRVDKCPFQTGSTCDDKFYFPPDVDWSGNSLYWGGSGPVPSSLATWFSSAHGSKMITKTEWDAAVSNWKTAHPGVK